jgi:hypothetical protein
VEDIEAVEEEYRFWELFLECVEKESRPVRME